MDEHQILRRHNAENSRRTVLLIFAVMGLGIWIPTSNARAQGSAKFRPSMQAEVSLVEVQVVGLRIPREQTPQPWQTEIVPPTNPPDTHRFILHAPETMVAPLAIVVQSFKNEAVSQSDIGEFASGLIHSLAPRMGARSRPAVGPVRYGLLEGAKSLFGTSQAGTALDVLMFVGQAPGKWPVLLQAQMAAGTFSSLAPAIDRCWTGIEYL
jgi:hypothetical protein